MADHMKANALVHDIFLSLKQLKDPMKHYRTEHPPNGNNKFNLNLTIKPVWKKGYLQDFLTGFYATNNANENHSLSSVSWLPLFL